MVDRTEARTGEKPIEVLPHLTGRATYPFLVARGGEDLAPSFKPPCSWPLPRAGAVGLLSQIMRCTVKQYFTLGPMVWPIRARPAAMLEGLHRAPAPGAGRPRVSGSQEIRPRARRCSSEAVELPSELLQVIPHGGQTISAEALQVRPRPPDPYRAPQRRPPLLQGLRAELGVALRSRRVAHPRLEANLREAIQDGRIERDLERAEQPGPRRPGLGDEILVSDARGVRAMPLVRTNQVADPVDEVDPVPIDDPAPVPPRLHDRRRDRERVAPEEDEAGVGEHAEEALRDQVVARRLVEEVPDAVRGRPLVEPLGERADLRVVGV